MSLSQQKRNGHCCSIIVMINSPMWSQPNCKLGFTCPKSLLLATSLKFKNECIIYWGKLSKVESVQGWVQRKDTRVHDVFPTCPLSQEMIKKMDTPRGLSDTCHSVSLSITSQTWIRRLTLCVRASSVKWYVPIDWSLPWLRIEYINPCFIGQMICSHRLIIASIENWVY